MSLLEEGPLRRLLRERGILKQEGGIEIQPPTMRTETDRWFPGKLIKEWKPILPRKKLIE